MKLGERRLFGLFGDPVGHSLSPYLQNEAFRLLGINGVYLSFAVKPEELGAAVAAVRCLKMGGVNITIPHKERIVPYLDRLAGDALLTGSVNTVVPEDGQLVGYSTDGEGFLLSLRHQGEMEPAGKKAVLLGVGGAARAVAFRLVQEGVAALYLVGRNPEKTAGLQAALRERTGFAAVGLSFADPDLAAVAAEADLVINATPLGMYPVTGDHPPLPAHGLPPRLSRSRSGLPSAGNGLLARSAAARLAYPGGVGDAGLPGDSGLPLVDRADPAF
ncbi:shikimate dehydrogenase family protein [Capillibacterium thermochitinicola]|uniref:Shikimate dehydrogenase n=1 Tax=Capillibacterium thermochitinicola TaxID=2699427 RepID=A0A8J6HZI2_9FIRM|nr:shikimate dehydrogenase [Capillibacterium thermochitinicola]MBA2132009.1 shikimate dehydrogenase [Capillibacterium thermochitinicola]